MNSQYKKTQEFFDLILAAKLDCIMMPGFPTPALKHGHSKMLSSAAPYTFFHNVTDMPTSAIPVDITKPGDDV